VTTPHFHPVDVLTWPLRTLAEIHETVSRLPARLDQMEARMAEREDAAYANLTATIQTVKDGWAAQLAKIAALEAALAEADAEQAAAVADALAADSEFDAAKVEAADAALAELTAPAEPVE